MRVLLRTEARRRTNQDHRSGCTKVDTVYGECASTDCWTVDDFDGISGDLTTNQSLNRWGSVRQERENVRLVTHTNRNDAAIDTRSDGKRTFDLCTRVHCKRSEARRTTHRYSQPELYEVEAKQSKGNTAVG